MKPVSICIGVCSGTGIRPEPCGYQPLLYREIRTRPNVSRWCSWKALSQSSPFELFVS